MYDKQGTSIGYESTRSDITYVLRYENYQLPV